VEKTVAQLLKVCCYHKKGAGLLRICLQFSARLEKVMFTPCFFASFLIFLERSVPTKSVKTKTKSMVSATCWSITSVFLPLQC